MNRGEPKHHFEFGPFRVDTSEKILLRDGMPVPLTPKVYEVLIALLENHGRTVGTNELIETIWSDSFVETGNLNRNISTLRSILGDDPHRPRFIRTLPKRGYRFDAEVQEITDDDHDLLIEKRKNVRISYREETTGDEFSAGVFSRYMLAVIALFSAIPLIFAIAWVFSGWTRDDRARATAASPTVGGTTNEEAFALYERGRSLWQDRSGESLHEATLLLEKAVAVDPGFALAHSALADAYVFDSLNRLRSVETAKRAVELEPRIGEPFAAIGFNRMFWDWNLSEAELLLKKAVTLSPNYATGHQWYSLSLIASGKGNAALSEMNRALELEPDSLAINADLCQMLYFRRLFNEAEAQCKKTLEMDPKFVNANLYLYDVLTASGKYDEAVERFFEIESIVNHYSAYPGELAALKREFEIGGIKGFWRKRVEMLRRLPSTDYRRAIYHARLGEKGEALDAMELAYKNRDLNFIYFLSDPALFACCFNEALYEKLETQLLGFSPRHR